MQKGEEGSRYTCPALGRCAQDRDVPHMPIDNAACNIILPVAFSIPQERGIRDSEPGGRERERKGPPYVWPECFQDLGHDNNGLHGTRNPGRATALAATRDERILLPVYAPQPKGQDARIIISCLQIVRLGPEHCAEAHDLAPLLIALRISSGRQVHHTDQNTRDRPVILFWPPA